MRRLRGRLICTETTSSGNTTVLNRHMPGSSGGMGVADSTGSGASAMPRCYATMARPSATDLRDASASRAAARWPRQHGAGIKAQCATRCRSTPSTCGPRPRASSCSSGRAPRVGWTRSSARPRWPRAPRARRCAPPCSQDDLRVRAAAKTPHAERLLFTREALEQATAWPVADGSRAPLRPRAGRAPGRPGCGDRAGRARGRRAGPAGHRVRTRSRSRAPAGLQRARARAGVAGRGAHARRARRAAGGRRRLPRPRPARARHAHATRRGVRAPARGLGGAARGATRARS